MGSVLRPCLDCGALTPRSRCALHERRLQHRRNAEPLRAIYREATYRSAPSTGICHLCGEPGADTRDHVVPIIAGGTNDRSNLLPAHRDCNSAKGGRT